MEDAARVRQAHGVAQLHEDAQVLLEPVGGRLALGEHVGPGPPLDALQNDDRRAVGPEPEVIDRNDVGVLEGSRHPRLTEETQRRPFVLRVRSKRLHGDASTQRALRRHAHDAHTAFANRVAHLDGARHVAVDTLLLERLERASSRGARVHVRRLDRGTRAPLERPCELAQSRTAEREGARKLVLREGREQG